MLYSHRLSLLKWCVIFCVFGIAWLFLSLRIQIAHAVGTPSIISYQGRLADNNGDLLGGAGTTYYFKFSIWTTSATTTGTRLWPASAPSSASLTVRQGVFNVNIGDTTSGFPNALNYDFATNNEIYLQVEVSSDNSTFQTLSPRQRIGSSAFSQLSSAVSGTTTPSSFGTTTSFANSVVSIEATSTNSIPLTVRGFASQIANLFQVQNAGLSNLFSIDSLGRINGFVSSASSTVDGDFFVSGVFQASSTLHVGGAGTSTFAGGIQTTRLGGTTASSTLAGLTLASGGLRVATLTSGSCDLKADADGNVTCGTDATSAASLERDFNQETFNGATVLTPTTTIELLIKDTASSTFLGPVRTQGLTGTYIEGSNLVASTSIKLATELLTDFTGTGLTNTAGALTPQARLLSSPRATGPERLTDRREPPLLFLLTMKW
ncbi:MAG: cell wall surface anchor family protein [Parcubacteria group bacterium Greene1014_15]|nr:MAG: cell wall surface anchor family protein [Parcubacteria group bacterium Greene1014_15]